MNGSGRRNIPAALFVSSAAAICLTVSMSANAQGSPQQEIQVCEQTVQYRTQPPAPDVPEHAKGFWGVWVGRIGNFCNALIVSSVKADATARGIYVWGARGYGSQPGKRSFEAKISGYTLEILWSSGPKVSYSRSGDIAYPLYLDTQGFRNRGEVKRQ